MSPRSSVWPGASTAQPTRSSRNSSANLRNIIFLHSEKLGCGAAAQKTPAESHEDVLKLSSYDNKAKMSRRHIYWARIKRLKNLCVKKFFGRILLGADPKPPVHLPKIRLTNRSRKRSGLTSTQTR